MKHGDSSPLAPVAHAAAQVKQLEMAAWSHLVQRCALGVTGSCVHPFAIAGADPNGGAVTGPGRGRAERGFSRASHQQAGARQAVAGLSPERLKVVASSDSVLGGPSLDTS